MHPLTSIIDRLVNPLPESVLFRAGGIGKDAPVGIYLHIPYCPTICAFCAFSKKPDIPEERDRYVKALATEVDLFAEKFKHNPVEWVYFGGGTPSTLSGKQLKQIMASVSRLNLRNETSVTFEARLDTLTPSALSNYREAGINRLSVGVQTLDNEERRKFGLRLKSNAVCSKLGLMSKSHIPYNVDLIFGAPAQRDPTIWRQTLSTVLAFRPDQITAYLYMPLEGTRTHRSYRSCNFLQKKQMSDILVEMMADAGYLNNDIFMFTREKTTANTPYADISMVASETMIVGFGQSAYSFFGKHAAVNPLDAAGYIRAVTAKKDIPFLAVRYNWLMKALRKGAAWTTRLNKTAFLRGSRFNLWQIFFVSVLWVWIYTLIRNWNTRSPLVSYTTGTDWRKKSINWKKLDLDQIHANVDMVQRE